MQLFLDFLKSTNQEIFIEVEAKEDAMKKFIEKYNNKFSTQLNLNSEGIRCLSEDVDKWGIEFRIYFNDIMDIPDNWNTRICSNKKYRSNEFLYRINDKELTWFLFDNGYQLGYN